MDKAEYKYRIAVATSDGIVVNQHFGRAREFLIIGLDEEDRIHRIETRSAAPACESGNHDEGKLEATAKAFADCKYLLASRIGDGAAFALERFGIHPMELPGIIEESVQKLLAYEELQDLLS